MLQNDDGLIQRDEFYAWYQTSMFWSMKNKKIEDASSDDLKEEEEDDEVDPLTWPSEASCAVKTMWIFSAPLAFLFAYTVPDCKDTVGGLIVDQGMHGIAGSRARAGQLHANHAEVHGAVFVLRGTCSGRCARFLWCLHRACMCIAHMR